MSNLAEALGELLSTYEHVYFLELGQLPKDCRWIGDVSDYIAYLRKQEKSNPFGEMSLFVRLEHAYHHLNWAWNCRRTPEARVWHFTDSDADRWNRFPDTVAFADLWPSDRSVKGRGHQHVGTGRRKVCLEVVRIHLQMACIKLNTLCYLVSKKAGEVWPHHKGLKPEVEKQPLTEKEFARRMHLIYVFLNLAWNSRKDKTFVGGKRTIDWRRHFSPVFATGCYNMWTRRKYGR